MTTVKIDQPIRFFFKSDPERTVHTNCIIKIDHDTRKAELYSGRKVDLDDMYVIDMMDMRFLYTEESAQKIAKEIKL